MSNVSSPSLAHEPQGMKSHDKRGQRRATIYWTLGSALPEPGRSIRSLVDHATNRWSRPARDVTIRSHATTTASGETGSSGRTGRGFRVAEGRSTLV